MPARICLGDLSDVSLRKLIKDAESEGRRRAIKKILAQKCQCDRYTCYRCQQLQHLNYHETE